MLLLGQFVILYIKLLITFIGLFSKCYDEVSHTDPANLKLIALQVNTNLKNWLNIYA